MGETIQRNQAADALVATAERALAAGDLNGAFAAYKACLAQHRDHPGAVAGMGLFLARHGEAATATQLLSRAMELADAALRARVAPALAGLLAELSPRAWHRQLDADLNACFAATTVEPQGLARVTAETLLLKQGGFDGSTAALEAMGGDPLWLAFLSRCVNVSAEMEAGLNAVRAALLAVEDMEGETLRALVCALGLSGFASEYAAQVPSGAPSEASDAVGLIASMFRPLTVIEATALGQDGPMQAQLVLRTVTEPERERTLRETLPTLTPEGEDAVSVAVREQYEANPYPRWSAPPAPSPRALRDAVVALPGLDRRAFGEQAQRLLVAGCGTGFEPIDLARMDRSLNITAMDLSRASLAHGARVADELGLTNVRFVQGDILALDLVEERFDIVTSTGVIHHMARPQDGLAKLAGVTRPGGVIRLGLYSERARALVRLAHDVIVERGWRATDEDIRAFRAYVLALPDSEPLAALKQSADFYSLSGCRDLVFHVQEHRYTPPQLAELVEGAGLRLVGFEAPPEAIGRFREMFGAADSLDLNLWDRLEAQHPTLFAGMYHLWAQKPV